MIAMLSHERRSHFFLSKNLHIPFFCCNFARFFKTQEENIYK